MGEPQSACRAVLAAARSHPLVLLGESHRSIACHRFLRELVLTPGFADSFDDIVIEFGNARYQPILDRYIGGEDVPLAELQQVWRNTTQLLAWDSPLYATFLATVRRANAQLPPARRLRVLAGDPPIDWAAVQTAADFSPRHAARDIDTLQVIERQVLQRGRRALVVIGGAHVYRRGPGQASNPPALERATLGDQLQRLHPGAAYVIETVFGDGPRPVAQLLRQRLDPWELLPLAGTDLAGANSGILFGTDITMFRVVDGTRVELHLTAADFPPLDQVVDALLYLGVDNDKLPAAAAVYLDDPAYTAEIRRRIAILTAVYGGDFWSEELDAVLAGGR